MLTKHFIKTLIIFAGMITLGLLGVFLVGYFDSAEPRGDETQVAE